VNHRLAQTGIAEESLWSVCGKRIRCAETAPPSGLPLAKQSHWQAEPQSSSRPLRLKKYYLLVIHNLS